MRRPWASPAERYGQVVPRPILIVEDDRVTLGAWTDLLHAAGYDVIAATSFAEARRAIERGPRLLIVDVRLGTYNGLHILIVAKSTIPDLAAIVVTGFADPVVTREAERLGAKCLEKPVDANRLLEAVANAIDHSRADARVGGQSGSPGSHSGGLPHAQPIDVQSSLKRLRLTDGDVVVVREPAGVSRPYDDTARSSPGSQFSVSVLGEVGVRQFGSYDVAIACGEREAVVRRARLFYVDMGLLVLVKDPGPSEH